MKRLLYTIGLLLLVSVLKAQQKIPCDSLLYQLFIDHKTLHLNSPRSIFLADSLMLICDEHADSVFHYFNGNKLVARFGREGTGVNEFRSITSMSPYVHTDSVCVFDINNKRVYSMKLFPTGYAEWNCLFQTQELFHYDVLPVTQNRYLSAGIYRDARFYLLDSIGNVIYKYDVFPYRDESEKKRDRFILAQAYMGDLCIHPDGERFVATNYSSKIIAFYQVIKNEVCLRKEIIEGYPNYHYDDDSKKYLGMGRETPSAYISMTATKNYIYVLYSGVSYAENPYLSSNGKTVYVYTWEGEKIRQLELDIPVSQIVVSGDDRTLYAKASNPYPEILRFDLSGTDTPHSREKGFVWQPKVVKIGEYLADADLYDLEGTVHHLADYKGKYLLLDFWRLNCGPCQHALPELKEIAEQYKDSITVISLSHDDEKTWRKASREKNITWPNLNDLKGLQGIFARYGVYGVPHFVLISPEGNIVTYWSGYGKGHLKQKIKTLLPN